MALRETPPQITKQLCNWWKAFWFWNFVHYSLGLTSSIGTAWIAANKATQFEYLPIAIAVATAAITFLKSGAKANAYIAAWRYLNAERIAFELDPSYGEAQLADHHRKAEAIIGKAD
ncbi:hypothetical protein [Propionivibrio sp.]|uniref:hypothetical protein n=1 Tax=Propionivibrio sp. TaxID=2212460 RepID=UPI0025F3E4F4|nr:hypothetical protein [Propionivibrio sp.]MBK7357170.1 hypothetical protein [Propionivibrio sp.]